MNLFDALASDPNLDPAFRRIFSQPARVFAEPAQAAQLVAQHAKVAPRRFLEQPGAVSAFGSLYGMSAERAQEIRDEELAAQRDSERFERIWGAE